jgi:hypothetical protein
VPEAHACNPSYLEGRDQEDVYSKPAQENNSQDLILKTSNIKQGCTEFKLHTEKNKKAILSVLSIFMLFSKFYRVYT